MGCAIDAAEGEGVVDGGVVAGVAAGEPVVVVVDGLLRRRPIVTMVVAEAPLMGAALLKLLPMNSI